MYSEKLKALAKKIELVHLPPKFKFAELNDVFDTMELYEELFDYSYEIINDLPLVSNFNVFRKNKDKVTKYFEENVNDDEIGEICSICYEFCIAIFNILL